MSKQQLYIKNDKGRYEPYEPKEFGDGNVYRKVGNKYVPFGVVMRDEDWLQSGVFVVRSDKKRGMRSFAESEYLQECFRIDKISNNYRITTEQLACLEDYADFCIQELRKHEKMRSEAGYGMSPMERVECIVGSVFKYSGILRDKIDKELSQERQSNDIPYENEY